MEFSKENFPERTLSDISKTVGIEIPSDLEDDYNFAKYVIYSKAFSKTLFKINIEKKCFLDVFNAEGENIYSYCSKK